MYFNISDPTMRNKIFLACAIVLVVCVSWAVCCDEGVCVSIVSKCLLIKSCDCDMTSLKNCTCCKDCQLCLSKLYTECCSCVGWYFHFFFMLLHSAHILLFCLLNHLFKWLTLSYLISNRLFLGTCKSLHMN